MFYLEPKPAALMLLLLWPLQLTLAHLLHKLQPQKPIDLLYCVRTVSTKLGWTPDVISCWFTCKCSRSSAFSCVNLFVWPCFLRLDYSGIALLIMGSFVPWLYYSFYCSPQPRLIYLTIVCVLGIAAIIVAQWDRFSTPRHRPTRAGAYCVRCDEVFPL